MSSLWVVALLASLVPSALEIDLKCARPVAVISSEMGLVVTDPSTGEEVLRQEVAFPWHGKLDLDRPLSRLRLQVVSPRFWAPPLILPEENSPGIVELELFERGEISFSLEKPAAREGEAPRPPGPITVEVSSSPIPREKDKLKKTRLECELEGEKWHCPSPALMLDLRLDKPQHVPRYVWNVKVEPGKTLDLGLLRFQRGASVSGFVTVEEGEPKGTRVVVEPAGIPSAREGQRRELRRLESSANERGFFQVLGVAPGGYRVEASRDGLAPHELSPVDVLEEQETTLAQPLFLARAAELELHVSPPLGPLGKPWKLVLVRTTSGSNVAAETIEESADENGLWVREALRPGEYFLNVTNPDGEETGSGSDSIWLTQMLSLSGGTQPLYIDIPVIAIEGTLRAGDEPLRGRLIFGGFFGAPHVVIWSDEEGEFAGLLPRKGEWDLDAEIDGQLRSLKKVNVEPRGGRPAKLDIQLPDTRFHGRVTHKGEPVEGASLWGVLAEDGRRSRFDIKTDDQGFFDLKGTDPGNYAVTVSSARLRLGAPKLHFEIHEGGEDPEVEIELEEFLKLEGQVLAGGEPVASAGFAALLRARQGEDTRNGFTTAIGVLGLTVPESTRTISLLVAAPGFAWHMLPLRPSLSGSFESFVVEVFQNGGELELHGDGLIGAQLSFTGADVPIYLIRSALQGTGYYESQESGILLRNATPGLYRVCRDKKCAEGVVAPGGTLRLDLETGI